MIQLEDNFIVCKCKSVSIGEIKKVIQEKGAKSLGEIQDLTTAGTDCRFCVFIEGDFGKIKKEVYLKDLLKEYS